MFAWLLGAEERIIKGHEIFFARWVHDGYVHYIEFSVGFTAICMVFFSICTF